MQTDRLDQEKTKSTISSQLEVVEETNVSDVQLLQIAKHI